MYHQKRTLGPDEKKWPHRILAGRDILAAEDNGERLRLKITLLPGSAAADGPLEEEDMDVDLVICATGYKRTAHIDMLKGTWPLLPEASAGETGLPRKDRWLVDAPAKTQEASTRVIEVGRDYGVQFSSGAVAPGSGIWLQGCCEATHGVSRFAPPAVQTQTDNISS